MKSETTKTAAQNAWNKQNAGDTMSTMTQATADESRMTRAEEKLLHPSPGSRIEAAREYGIDLTLLVERLRKTPEERVRELQRAAQGLEAIRGRARRNSVASQQSGSQGKRV